MASESSALTVYNSNVQNLVNTLSNRDADVNDRFDLIAKALLAGAQIVVEEHNERVLLQGKVTELEQEKVEQDKKINETGSELAELKEIRKQTLDKEIAKKIRVLKLREKVHNVTEKSLLIGVLVGGFTPAVGIMFPPSLLVLIPAAIGGVSLGLGSWLYIQKIFKEKWILEHYPEALDDEKARSIAEEEYLKVGIKEYNEKYPPIDITSDTDTFYDPGIDFDFDYEVGSYDADYGDMAF